MPKGINQLSTGTKKDGTPWTMYLITDQTDTEFKSFEALTLNTPYQISYEEEPRKPFVAKKGPDVGKMITPTGVDRFIKRAVITDAPPMGQNKQSGTVPQDRSLEAAWREIEAINKHVKALEDANNPDF